MRAPAPTLETVLDAIRAELDGTPAPAGPETPPAAVGVGIAELRRRVAGFRAEPLGGRLLPLKRIAYWFVASAFDRQTKLIEAMIDELAAQEAELTRLRALADEETGSEPPPSRTRSRSS